MVDYKLIGLRLKQHREQAKLTQEKVSEIVGITTVYLSKIENGKVHPTLDTLEKICLAVQCDLGDILQNSIVDLNTYQNDEVVKIFHSCSPSVKPIALTILKELSKIDHDVARE